MQYTKKDIARAIGWTDAMVDDLEFDEADWRTVDDDGLVRLHGFNSDDDAIDVVVQIVSVDVFEGAHR